MTPLGNWRGFSHMHIPSKIKRLKAELEKLTGKMVCFRSRAKYNETQRKLQKAKRSKH